MIDLKKIKSYYNNDNVFASEHAIERCRERGIKIKDIKSCIFNGEIIEQYPDDYPFPSCLICGQSLSDKIIHVVVSDEGTASRIITAYYPDPNRWSHDYKIRKRG